MFCIFLCLFCVDQKKFDFFLLFDDVYVLHITDRERVKSFILLESACVFGGKVFLFSICHHLTGNLLECIVASDVWISATAVTG